MAERMSRAYPPEINGKVDGRYGVDYYSGDNTKGPYGPGSFTKDDGFPGLYVWILNKMYPFDRKAVLDVGCCRGAYVREMLRNGSLPEKSFGIDFSEFCLLTTEIPAQNFLCRDLMNPIPFADESFDFVLANDILEHFYEEDSLALLDEIHRVTKIGGIVSINVGQGECPEHLFLASYEYWDEAFQKHGFKSRPDLLAIFRELQNKTWFKQYEWSQLFILERI